MSLSWLHARVLGEWVPAGLVAVTPALQMSDSWGTSVPFTPAPALNRSESAGLVATKGRMEFRPTASENAWILDCWRDWCSAGPRTIKTLTATAGGITVLPQDICESRAKGSLPRHSWLAPSRWTGGPSGRNFGRETFESRLRRRLLGSTALCVP